MRNFFRINNKWFWICSAFIIKFGFLLFFLQQENKSLTNFFDTLVGKVMGDTNSYLNPIDNLVENGTYDPDFRMPGYGFIYFLFRFFLNRVLAANILIFLQVVLSVISVYCLAKLSTKMFNSEKIFFVVFFLYAISTYTSYFDSVLLTESFATSSLIFSFYFLHKYFEKEKVLILLLAGIFMCWCIFLRPIFVPVLVLQFLFVALRYKKTLPLFILVLPFVCAESYWLLRNYSKHKKVIFLTQSKNYPWADKNYEALGDFVTSFGGNRYYEPGSEIVWFEYYKTPGISNETATIPPPFSESIYTSQFNADSLIVLKKMIGLSYNSSMAPWDVRDNYKKDIAKKLSVYTQSVKDEHFFLYYFVAPAKILKRFIFQSGSHFLFFQSFYELSFLQKSVKLFYSALYWLIACGGILASIVMLFSKKQKNSMVCVMAATVLYFVLVHPIFLRLSEERFIVPVYPFLLTLTAGAFVVLTRKFRKRG